VSPVPLIPGALDHVAAVDRVARGQFLGVGGAEESRGWVVNPGPRRPEHAAQAALAVTGWNRDKQVLDPTGRGSFQVLTKRLDVPARDERCRRLNDLPRLPDEFVEALLCPFLRRAVSQQLLLERFAQWQGEAGQELLEFGRREPQQVVAVGAA